MDLSRPGDFVNAAASPFKVERTGQSTDFQFAQPRALSPSMRRALEIRVEKLSAEQRAAAREIEELYWRSNKLTFEVLERQKHLRRFREVLLNWGAQ